MKPHLLGLRARFIILVLAGVGLISAVMAWITFDDSRQALLESRQEQIFDLAQAQATKLSRSLIMVSQSAKTLANLLETYQPKDAAELEKLLRRQLSQAPGIFGMAAAYAPGAFVSGPRLTAPYLHRTRQGIKVTSLADSGYNFMRWDWYLIPTLLARPVWSEPYFDEGGGGKLMTTYSAPMVVKGSVRGVITADVDLARLGREVNRLAVGREGFAFLISRQGTFLASPRPKDVMHETIFSLAEQYKRPKMRALGRRMIRGAAGVVESVELLSGGKSWLAFHPVQGPGWSLGVVIPESEILAPAYALAREQIIGAGAGLIAMVAVVWLLVMGLTRPLRNLAAAAGRLAAGDLSVKVDNVRPGDEVGDLAQSFNTMVDELHRYVDELTATTAAKERIQSELDLANQIQQSILPSIYPAFPDCDEFDLFAKNIPAREVGGDFYDFYFVDERRLGLVVGDVSGKGIPAALFMTVASTLIKNAAHHHKDPAAVLQEANAAIEPGNDMCMFVTIFYGVYDLDTGRLVYANAGHPPPLLRRASGEVSQLPQTKGSAVGVMPTLDLEEGELTLGPEDVLLVFTDGLDEAVNSQDEMFGLKRAADWLARAEVTEGPVMVQRLEQFQKDFTGPVEQFDDLTLLIFRRKL